MSARRYVRCEYMRSEWWSVHYWLNLIVLGCEYPQSEWRSVRYRLNLIALGCEAKRFY